MGETMDETREVAIAIITEFEELLERHKIKIPDNDRVEDNDLSASEQACIYGATYYKLEDAVYNILVKAKAKWKRKS